MARFTKVPYKDCKASYKDCIVAGVNSDQLRRRLLSEDKLDLRKPEYICRSYEKAIWGAAAMKDPNSGEVNALNFRKLEQSYPQQGSNNLLRSKISKSYANSVVSTINGDVILSSMEQTCNRCFQKNHCNCSSLCEGRDAVGKIETDVKGEINSVFLGSLLEATTVTLLKYLCRLK